MNAAKPELKVDQPSPGPWRSDGNAVVLDVAGDAIGCAFVTNKRTGIGSRLPQQKANLVLMAAAPMMYETLCRVMADITGIVPIEVVEDIEVALSCATRVVVAATGQPPQALTKDDLDLLFYMPLPKSNITIDTPEKEDTA